MMRDSLLDVLKGYGIVLVIFAHTYKGEIQNVIYIYHMPLFFFLSGVTFSYASSGGLQLIKRKFRSIMLPYFSFSILSFIYWWLIESRFRPIHTKPLFDGFLGDFPMAAQQFINIFAGMSFPNSFLYNIVMWFLPCLFVASVLYYVVKLVFKQHAVFVCILLASVYFFFERQIPPLIWCAEIALVALPFMYGGETLYSWCRESPIKIQIVVVLVLAAICFIVISIYHPYVRMRSHHMGIWWQFYLLSFSMIGLSIYFCKLSMFIECGVLQWLGRNSVTLMCIHEPIKRITIKMFSSVSGYETELLRESFVMSMVIVLTIILLTVPIVIVINRYMPFLIGRKS